MTTPVSLVASYFAPSTALSGGESISVFRGENAVIRRFGDRARVENYPGHLDLSENYDLTAFAITGTISCSASGTTVTGSGTAFTTELHVGQLLLAANGNEVFCVKSITSDTSFVTDRPATAAVSGQAAYRLPVMCPVDGKRAVLLRGNAILGDRKDIIYAGDGSLFLNGTDTGFDATATPKRLERLTDGSYIEFPIGFSTTPTVPVISATTGGSKKMIAGSYSFLVAWFNYATEGFSNPSAAVKQDSTPTDLTIAAGGRFLLDFTNTYSKFTFADTDITIATGNVNKTAHGLVTGDTIKWRNIGGSYPTVSSGAAITATTPYYVIRVDADNFKVARSAALAQAGTAITFSNDGSSTNHIYKLPANANGCIVYMSQSGGGVAVVNQQYFQNGPWFKVAEVLITDLDANDQIYVEELDAALGMTASGDNDPPQKCEFITEFANTLMCISTLGKRSSDSDQHGVNPGNYVVSQKPSNFEAFPLGWRVSVGEEITGFTQGVGRLFCLTAGGVPFVTPTGRTELARLQPTLLDMPYTSRPFFTKGTIQPYGACVIQGDLFLFSGGQPLRSPSQADENNVVPFELGAVIDDLLTDWKDGYTFCVHSPDNQQLLLIGSAIRKNSSGYWTSEILPLDLRRGEWLPKITLSSTTRDMIVSGTAIVGNRLEFLAGGRVSGGAFTTSTFRYDERSGDAISYYVAFQPSDAQNESTQKAIRAFRPTGKLTSPVIQVHGAAPGGTLSISDIENGTNSITGNISLTTTTSITRYLKKKYLVKNLGLFTVRLSGTYGGTGDVDRLEELVLDLDLNHGGSY